MSIWDGKEIKEYIGGKTWGGKWWCEHIWKQTRRQDSGCFTITKNVCTHCGKHEILILIDWNKR